MVTSAPHGMHDGRAALRGAGWVAAQRGLHVVEGLLFAVIVPRLMGPESFGQYSLLVSMSLWFALMSSLGAVSMMTRSVPQFVVRGDVEGLQKLMSGLLGLRAASGVGAACLYLVVTATWLHEIDVVSLLLVAGAVFCRTTANICYAFFLGLNRAARWGAGELLRKWLILVLVSGGFVAAGIRGACAGFFVAQAVVLAYGLWGCREYVRLPKLRPDLGFLAPHLKTGAYFTGGNLLLALAQRSGEALVRASTDDYSQVAFYGAAFAIYMAGASAIWSTSVALAPMLVATRDAGREDRVGWWLQDVLTWSTIATVLALLTTALIGDDLVPLVLGRPYAPVARTMLPLAAALVARAPASVARLQSLVADRPGDAAIAAGLELAVFVGLGALLARGDGAHGAALAVLAGTVVNAAWLSWRMRSALPYTARPAALALLTAVPALPLAWIHGAPVVEIAVLAAAVGGYAAALLGLRIVRLDDLRQLIETLRGART